MNNEMTIHYIDKLLHYKKTNTKEIRKQGNIYLGLFRLKVSTRKT